MSENEFIHYDKVKVSILAKKKEDIGLYFRLFKMMLGEQVESFSLSNDSGLIETDKVILRFFIGSRSVLGVKAHYVINMHQDVDYDNQVVVPQTTLFHHLKNDPAWSELFN
ncbi:hypothetical protein AAXB25_14360 [Paenibacillus lautus]|uniref:hypothetical protein n=1 Tax=Paenibacillus lautus TaxID=1401 RepID=UPI003D2E8212